MARFLPLLLAVALSPAIPAGAQILELRTPSRSPGAVTVMPGDTIQIDVWAHLDSLSVSGISLHLSFPSEGLALLDNGLPGQHGTQPFLEGDLFPRGVVLNNRISDLPEEATEGRLHVEYSVLNGLGEPRAVTGSGRVASVQILVQHAFESGEVRIEDTPLLETRLVLPDGRTERRFTTLDDLSLSTQFTTSVRQETWGRVKEDPDAVY